MTVARPVHILAAILIAFIGVADDSIDSQARVNRKPTEVIEALSRHYGHRYAGSYLQALAMMVRAQNEGMEAVEPMLLKALDKKLVIKNGGQLSGQLVFCRLGYSNPKAKARVLKAAGLGLDGGKAKAEMPFHYEMSDAIFMSCPLLCWAAVLSEDPVYFDVAWNHLNRIRGLCLREDGLYRHSPLDEAAWGRGNGFPALGLSICLELMHSSHPRYEAIKAMQLAHLKALLPHQNKDGMWHQVVDHPESYAEFTCTCMISVAAIRGMRKGWLDREQWEPAVMAAWRAICGRISLDGSELNGCCTGTGKQKSLQAYFDRKEIHGRDERGGAMALLFANEMRIGY